MTKKIKAALCLALVAQILVHNAWAKIHSETVNYQLAGQAFQGYLSYDDAITGQRPGVLVVHEWWGNNAYAKKRADMLAELGYTAFALDMYGTGKLAKHPDDAQKFMQATLADIHVAETRFNEALRLIKQNPTVDPQKIAAIGYCFGGGMVLHMARIGSDLAGVVSFHGTLTTDKPAVSGLVDSKILVFNGADDSFVTGEQVGAFKQEMKSAGADLEFINYPGVKHGFTNTEADDYAKRFNMPIAYNAEADKDSWQHMQAFFKRIFAK
jgi:dienelactone hydrolase